MTRPPTFATKDPSCLTSWAYKSVLRETKETPEVRRAMLLTLREPIYVTVMAFFWTQATALAAWTLSGSGWALAWLGADVVLFLLCLVLDRRIAIAEERQEDFPTEPVFVAHSVWFALTALGSFLTVSQPDMRLALLGTILPIGFCGYVVSRWQAFPGFAACFIHGLWAGLFAGLLASPLPGLEDVAWLISAGGVAFHVLLGLNHRIIATALRAQQENRRLSMHDPLTELPNRLMLHERLSYLCRPSLREGMRPGFAVMCLDLDGFKEVNDRLGHAAGDWLLKSIAERLVATARPGDLVCRVGGDEFVVLLPDIANDDAIATAERFIDAVALPHDLGGLSSIPARISIGLAMAPGHGSDGDRLLAAADAALYEAKRAGKGTWRLQSV